VQNIKNAGQLQIQKAIKEYSGYINSQQRLMEEQKKDNQQKEEHIMRKQQYSQQHRSHITSQNSKDVNQQPLSTSHNNSVSRGLGNSQTRQQQPSIILDSMNLLQKN
jgi:hypothetical protein